MTRVERVVLVGFMASGKSTVGRRLAGLLAWDFLDFDDEIERRTGLEVSEIFEQEGEGRFREMEAALTEEVADASEIVLAPGGGWITQPDLLETLAAGTLSVWLRISPEEAVRRARDSHHRPLLAGPDPLGKAEAMLADRERFYRRADVAIEVDTLEPAEVAMEIAEIILDARG